MSAKPEAKSEPLAYGVEDLCKAIGNISRATFYRLVEKGEFHPFKIGSKTYVKASEAADFIERQMQRASEKAA